MAIPLSQLNTWSNRPDPNRSADTYDSIKNALAAWDGSQEFTYGIYLQGSYANATNVRADSDVDVVVELTSTYCTDFSELTPADAERYWRSGTITARSFDDSPAGSPSRYPGVLQLGSGYRGQQVHQGAR
jgi:hypothetical protein